MKNAGITIGMVAIGLGLASIGFNLNGNQANATPAAFAPAGGPGERRLVPARCQCKVYQCERMADPA